VKSEVGQGLVAAGLDRVRQEIARIIVGQQDVVDGVLIALVAG
jgi:MoxR-like ATPase